MVVSQPRSAPSAGSCANSSTSSISAGAAGRTAMQNHLKRLPADDAVVAFLKISG
jgi:hypothetical protein